MDLDHNIVLDLVPLPLETRVSDDGEAFSDHMRKIHQEVRVTLKANNESYANEANLHCHIKEFEEGVLVLAHQRREVFKGHLTQVEVKKVWIAKEL
ncbi:hypothetical protein V6N13_113063 [Hibiscus sabdariffa]